MASTTKLRQAGSDTAEDLKTLLHEAESALSSVTGEASDQVGDLRKRLRLAISDGKGSIERLRTEAIHKAREADQLVRNNPYYAIGIAAGVGAIIGILLAHRCSSREA